MFDVPDRAPQADLSEDRNIRQPEFASGPQFSEDRKIFILN
jgi:hypothetical protein